MDRTWSRWRKQREPYPPAPSDPAVSAGDPLAAALQMLAAHAGSTDAESASSVKAARELCTLATEQRSLAERLEDIALRHREIAASEGRAAIRALTAGEALDAVPSSERRMPASRTEPPAADVRTEPPDIAVRVLGPMEVFVGGEPIVRWRSTKIRTLFQYLVLNPRPAHREVLMELLWPGNTFNSARNNLNVCVYGLRRVLLNGGPPRDLIVYRDGCYTRNQELDWAVDRDRFRDFAADAGRLVGTGQRARAKATAERAVSLYAGPLFEGDVAAEWFLAERRSLRELYIQTLEILVDVQLDLRNDVNSARQTAERILREDISRESGHRLLMRCHDQLNQRDQVVRQYRLCRDTLAELGISPTAETHGLYEQLTGTGRPEHRA